jgi:hypothetical protein
VERPQQAAGVVEIGVAARPQAMPQLAVPRRSLAELNPDGLQRLDTDVEGRVVGPADRAPVGLRGSMTPLQDERELQERPRVRQEPPS